MASPLTRLMIRNISDDRFAKDKKLAINAIRANTVDGRVTARGYELAMGFIDQHRFSANEKDALDAENLFLRYQNDWTKLRQREKDRNRTVGQINLSEKQAFYAAATGAKARFIAANDIPGLVSLQRQILNENLFDVQANIISAEQRGEDTSSLYNALFDMHRRYKDIERLEDDLLRGDGSSLGEFGLFVDGDRNGIDGIMIAKTNDLPPGFDKGRYAPLNETAAVSGVSGGFLPVFGEVFVDQADRGRRKTVIGNRRWTALGGVTGSLNFDRASDPNYVSRPQEGSFSIADFAVNHSPLGKGEQYFTGITGFNEETGEYVRTLFKSPDGQRIYSIDEETRKRMSQDPFEAQKIEHAFNRNELDSRFIKERVMPNVKPFVFEEISQPVAPQSFGQSLSPDFMGQMSTDNRNNMVRSANSTAINMSDMVDRRNRPNQPEQATGEQGFVERAKGFFRNIF